MDYQEEQKRIEEWKMKCDLCNKKIRWYQNYVYCGPRDLHYKCYKRVRANNLTKLKGGKNNG